MRRAPCSMISMRATGTMSCAPSSGCRSPCCLPSSHLVATSAFRSPALLGHALPIAGVAGDQQAALFGQARIAPGGQEHLRHGCFPADEHRYTPLPSRNRLLTTIAWRRRGLRYALEASVFVAGAAVQWLRDGLGLIDDGRHETVAASVPDGRWCLLRARAHRTRRPHWEANARGTIVGLSRGTTRAHIARAALEAIAFQASTCCGHATYGHHPLI